MAATPIAVLAGGAAAGVSRAWAVVKAGMTTVDVVKTVSDLIKGDTGQTRTDMGTVQGDLTTIKTRLEVAISNAAAASAAATATGATQGNIANWVQEIEMMVIDMFARPAPWYNHVGFTPELTANRTTLRQVFNEAGLAIAKAEQARAQAAAATEEAISAKAQALEAKTTAIQARDASLAAETSSELTLIRLNEALAALGQYPLTEAGIVAYLSDQAQGRITGNGPITTLDGNTAVLNPLFFSYQARDGVHYPITSGLLADILNLVNLYPRP